MVIFLDLQGNAEKLTPQRIYQGSNAVTEISVVAPYAASTAMQIGFILPNGLYWNDPDGARYAPMEGVQQDIEPNVNVWTYKMPSSLTEQFGELKIAINALTTDGNTTSYLCGATVEESVLPNLPSAPDPSVYDLIQLYLARLSARTANVAHLVASIQKTASNAFTYTDNSGIVSAPIILNGGETPPMPLSAASVITIPLTAWQPVYAPDGTTVTGYTVTITASQHGQMTDNATAYDLWISFDTTDGGVIAGAYQAYTVSSAGDITLTVKTPVQMTLRVWNGKGVVDTTARAEIAAEIERAETAEQGLQAQIDEIEQSGVDLTARAEIVAERERAEAAEAQLQTNIDAEQTRAESAESALSSRIAENTSDIEGLREDVINEKHFRGMFESVAALEAAFPTATPNDYAYIVGGNVYIWQNGAWTDSGEPSPNTAVPASDAVPLMDGAGSAGTLAQYARGDHRHPENTRKYDKTGGVVSGLITAQGGIAFTSGGGIGNYNQPMPFYLGMQSWADGGKMFYRNPEQVKADLGVFSATNLPTAVKDASIPTYTTYMDYGADDVNWADFTYLAAWTRSGNTIRLRGFNKNSIPLKFTRGYILATNSVGRSVSFTVGETYELGLYGFTDDQTIDDVIGGVVTARNSDLLGYIFYDPFSTLKFFVLKGATLTSSQSLQISYKKTVIGG